MKKTITLQLLLLGVCAAYNVNAQTANLNKKNKNMEQTLAKTDKEKLSELNAQFIRNFVNMDTASHNEIIYKDFVCIENNGTIVGRDEYMKGWATDYKDSKLKTFYITDEVIRIFGNFALVRSKTVYTREKDGQIIPGNSIYTDTYLKENGRWWCVQAQITPMQK